jgi:prevent-host-death family protein
MKIASLADVKAKFSAYVKSTSRSPVVITRNGKAVAAIIPLSDDEDLERLMLGYSPRLRAVLDKGQEQVRRGQSVSHEDLWKQVRKGSTPARGRKSA